MLDKLKGEIYMKGLLIGVGVFIAICMGIVLFLVFKKKAPQKQSQKKITISENGNETIVRIEKDN